MTKIVNSLSSLSWCSIGEGQAINDSSSSDYKSKSAVRKTQGKHKGIDWWGLSARILKRDIWANTWMRGQNKLGSYLKDENYQYREHQRPWGQSHPKSLHKQLGSWLAWPERNGHRGKSRGRQELWDTGLMPDSYRSLYGCGLELYVRIWVE